MVEAAGIEPASESDLRWRLRAYSVICIAADCAHGQARTVAIGPLSFACYRTTNSRLASSITPRPLSTGGLMRGDGSLGLIRPRERLRYRWQLFVPKSICVVLGTDGHATSASASSSKPVRPLVRDRGTACGGSCGRASEERRARMRGLRGAPTGNP